MKKIIGITLIMCALLALSSCCGCSLKSPNGGELTGSEWQLVQIEGRGVKAEGEKYTLNLSADNKLSGVGDCNRLSGTFTYDKIKGTLDFGPIAATRMLCPDQVAENLFINTLGVINSYKVDGKMLMLFANGELKMMLEKKK